MADDEWKKDLERFDERTVKRRARAKEQGERAQEMIREAEERREEDHPAERLTPAVAHIQAGIMVAVRILWASRFRGVTEQR